MRQPAHGHGAVPGFPNISGLRPDGARNDGKTHMKAIEEFKDIQSGSVLYAFLKRCAFVKETHQTSAQILGVYHRVLDGAAASITDRWYDPSGPFRNEPDIHKAKLVVTGHGNFVDAGRHHAQIHGQAFVVAVTCTGTVVARVNEGAIRDSMLL
jgi:hypothetical protein